MNDVITPPPGPENWTLQDALDCAGPLPENLGRATALASETTLAKFWDNAEDDAADFERIDTMCFSTWS